MAKKFELTDDDKIALQEAMRGVKRISQTKITVAAKPRLTQRTKMKLKEPDEIEFSFSDFEKLELVSSEDLLQFYRPGLQHKIIRKLRGGQYNVEAVLDLHGMTVEDARHSLGHFLVECKQGGIRHVLIIHGKGRSNSKPILKNKLNHWLRQTEEVLAFCSATAKDGSSGALYVLLRR